jgi:hypothetical protein
MATTADIRLLGTAISPEYIKSWDVPMAIRELLQNLLDTKREFGASGAARYNKQRGLAELKDNGPGLELRHLALGISEKGADSVGQFGEGLKLALLLFAREGRFIEVRSKGYRLAPVIRPSEFGTETLFFQVEEMGSSVQGTTVRFECSQEELNDGKSYFPTEFNVSQEHKVSWVLKDKISLPGGRIFINGSMVANIPDSLFSYHLWGEDAKKISNRDRSIVDHGVLKRLIKDNITGMGDGVPVSWYQKCLEEMSLDNYRHIFEMDIPSYQQTENLQIAFKKVFGSKAIVSQGYSHQDQLAIRLGFKPVYISSYDWRWVLSHGELPTVYSLLKEKPLSALTEKVGGLSNGQENRLTRAIELVEKHYHAPVEPLVVVKSLDEAMAEGVRGTYNRQEDTIYIVERVLDDLETAVEVILHEAVHKKSGADDLSPDFQAAQDKLAAGLLLELAKERA